MLRLAKPKVGTQRAANEGVALVCAAGVGLADHFGELRHCRVDWDVMNRAGGLK
jgi:hypothetical protein